MLLGKLLPRKYKQQLKTASRWLGLVNLLIQRDLRVRYRGSFLGYLWSMLNPLLYMIVLSTVFSYIVRFEVEHYPLFLLAGILIWNFFQQSLSIGVNSILFNGSLLKKVRVPAALFPMASIGSVMVNFFLALIPFIIISFYLVGTIHSTLLFLPVTVFIFSCFIFGIALTLASLNVKYRDVSHMLDPILTIGFYATPIIYPQSAIPEKFRFLIDLNPLSYYLDIIRSLMFDGSLPNARNLMISIALAMAALLLGSFTFNHMKREFIYDL